MPGAALTAPECEAQETVARTTSAVARDPPDSPRCPRPLGVRSRRSAVIRWTAATGR